MDIDDIISGCGAAITRMSDRLRELEAEIRDAQPIRHGAVLMELYRHKPPCLGCPHVTWKQWKGHPHHPTRTWQAHRLASPLVHLPRGDGAATLRLLVREALSIEQRRTKLVQHLSVLAQVLHKAPERHSHRRESAGNPRVTDAQEQRSPLRASGGSLRATDAQEQHQ